MAIIVTQPPEKITEKPKEEPKDNVTDSPRTIVGIALDRSSSMSSIKDSIISAFNEQLDTLRKGSKDGMETTVTLVTFSTTVDAPKFFNDDIANVPELNKDNYEPQGSTAMLDAVTELIDKIDEIPGIEDENTAVLIWIVSDGEENNSTKSNWNSVAEKISGKNKSGRWTFTYMGANQDLAVVSERLNINLANTMNFSANAAGVNLASSTNSSGLANYMSERSRGVMACSSFYGSNAD